MPSTPRKRIEQVGSLASAGALESFPATLPGYNIRYGSIPGKHGFPADGACPALLLLLAALAAPAPARSTPENRTEEKSARNAEWLRSPTAEMPEIHWGKALTTQYDASGDSFTAKERSGEAD